MELPHGGAFVTGVALQRGVRAHQRETILVILNLLHRDLPSLDAVALFATGAELSLMNVRVAIGTSAADVAEDQLCVARGARHLQVHATQRILRLVMIEFRDTADRLPAAEGVTVLARDVQWPVRTVGGGLTALLG